MEKRQLYDDVRISEGKKEGNLRQFFFLTSALLVRGFDIFFFGVDHNFHARLSICRVIAGHRDDVERGDRGRQRGALLQHDGAESQQSRHARRVVQERRRARL